ncbi:MAG TPA: hypothetical protein VGI10_28180, partial [Polyangiaceae bacterium]
ATSGASNYATWSATVPLAAAESQTPCPGAPVVTGKRDIAVPVQVLVPGLDGLAVAETVDAGCTIFPDSN